MTGNLDSTGASGVKGVWILEGGRDSVGERTQEAEQP